MAKSLFDLVISSFLKYIYIYIVGKADSKNVHEMYYNIHDNIHIRESMRNKFISRKHNR